MYRFEAHVPAKEHDDFNRAHELGNLLQTSAWAKVKDNWDHELVGVYEENQLVASALVLIKALPLHFSMMYIPRGPIMDYTNASLLSFFFQEMRKWAKQRHCLFIKMDPTIHINDYPIEAQNTDYYEIKEIVLRNMKDAGCIHQGFTTYIKESIQPRFQANVYFDENFEQHLPRHTKRLIKDALRRHVKAVQADSSRIDEFSAVVLMTEERKHVALRNQEYFKQLMEIYGDDAVLFLAEVDVNENLDRLAKEKAENEKQLANLKEGQPKKARRLEDMKRGIERDIQEFEAIPLEAREKTVIAGILSVRCGDTLEMLYAGMDDRFKKFMPQYYLYTETMKYAFAHGMKFANMGGVEGDLKDGLTKFKSNFNPMINEFIGEFDLPVNRLLYKASRVAYQMRKERMAKRKN